MEQLKNFTGGIYFTSVNELIPVLRQLIREELELFDKNNKSKSGEKIYTINEVAKKLGKSWVTINKYCRVGLIRTVPGRGIPESAIIEFLEGGRK